MAEADFPRGGSNSLSALERREIAQQAEADAAAEQIAGTGRARKRKAATLLTAIQPTGAGGGDTAKRRRTENGHATILSNRTLKPGMAVYGVVSTVQDVQLTVALPDAMTGVVRLDEVSPELKAMVAALQDKEDDDVSDDEMGQNGVPSLTSLYRPGQPVLCSVLQTALVGKRHRIDLSMSPLLLNSGLEGNALQPGRLLAVSISSVEDHGYVANLGLPNKSGFITKAEATTYVKEVNEGLDLQVGQTVLCTILSHTDGRVVKLSVDPAKVVAAKLAHPDELTFNSVTPGLLVTATITRTLGDNGLELAFLGLEGSVDTSHLPAPLRDGDNVSALYPAKKKIRARVLFVDRENKLVGLTLR